MNNFVLLLSAPLVDNIMFLLTLSAILVTFLIYKLIIKPMRYWDKLGIKRPKWYNFIYFNWLSFLRPRSSAEIIRDIYECVPDTRYHGLHQFNSPTLMLKDPELIKHIAIKAFDHFTDRNFSFGTEDEPFMGKNLLNLKGQKWRNMRNYLSPSFTTNKMKIIFRIMDKCCKSFTEYFANKQDSIIETDMMDAFTRYTNDVIASSVFGVEVDSLKEPNNEFYLRGRQATDLTKPSTVFKVLCSLVTPTLYKLLGLRILPKDTTDFFIKLINDTLKLREDGKIVQIDMIHLLLEAKKEYEAQEKIEQTKNTKGSITNEDITAQAFIFFFAGFDSVARTMCFMAYELAVNPDIQQRLREEIEEANANCNEKLTYDVLMELKYMDMVVSEVLRKYPIQVATDRVCTKPYAFESTPGEKPVPIDVGTAIIIPTFALHRNSEFFPDPEKFDPERFSDENRGNIKPYAYQPFSIGPRACIGSRFALMETKLVYFHLLRKFEIVPTEKTKIPLVFLKSLTSLSSEYGFWFGLKTL